jgi:periplasmic divalent cation tolerance protein
MPYQLILNTCPDLETAQSLAHKIIKSELAACVNILPSVTSIYRWQGKVAMAQEHLLLIKAPSSQYTPIEQCITTHHPYTVPEIIAFSIENGLPAYLQWIDSCAPLK